MSHLKIEIISRCNHFDIIRRILRELNAVYKGTDQQVDTYFNIKNGRLKFREGSNSCSLIHYKLESKIDPMGSIVTICHPIYNPKLKEILINSLGIINIVKKKEKLTVLIISIFI